MSFGPYVKNCKINTENDERDVDSRVVHLLLKTAAACHHINQCCCNFLPPLTYIV